MTSKITLSKGNTKLGRMLNWSLPPISTCPSKTTLCEKFCYALKSYKQYPNVKNAWDTNYIASQEDDFEVKFNTELAKWKKKKYNIVRVHTSGEFYNIAYAKKILNIIIANPDVTFYAYTKQWRDSSFTNILLAMSLLTNCTILASTDAETIANGETIPSFLREATVVSRKGITANPNLIACPQQSAKIASCEKCGLCFKDYHKKHKRGVAFIEH